MSFRNSVPFLICLVTLSLGSSFARAADCSGELRPYSDAVGGKQRFGFLYEGQVAIPAQFEEIGGRKESAFCNGLALVKQNGLWGYIDKRGVTIIPFQYQQAKSFSNGIAAVRLPLGWTFIAKDGKNLCAGEPFFYVETASEGIMGVRALNGEGNIRHGFVDLQCKPVGALDFDDAGVFHLGIAPVQRGGDWFWLTSDGVTVGTAAPFEAEPEFWNDLWEVRRGGKRGLVGAKGQTVLDTLYSGFNLYEGRTIGVRVGPDHKWAFYDLDKAAFLTPFSFLEIRPFSDDLAGVRMEESTSLKPNPWGFIDRTGAWVIAPSYMYIEKDFVKGKALVALRENIYVATITRRWINKLGQAVAP